MPNQLHHSHKIQKLATQSNWANHMPRECLSAATEYFAQPLCALQLQGYLSCIKQNQVEITVFLSSLHPRFTLCICLPRRRTRPPGFVHPLHSFISGYTRLNWLLTCQDSPLGSIGDNGSTRHSPQNEHARALDTNTE